MNIISLFIFSIISPREIIERFYNFMIKNKNNNIFMKGLLLHQNKVIYKTQTIFSTEDYIEKY